MPEIRPKYHRDCLEDANLAPVMTPALWDSYAQLSKRYPVIMGVLAYIMEMAKEDMMEMGNTLIETESGKLKMARLQGQVVAKQIIVGRICDLMGDLEMAGEQVDSIDVSDSSDVPSWLTPDEDEEEKEKKKSRYRKTPRPSARMKPLPPAKKCKPPAKRVAPKRRRR